MTLLDIEVFTYVTGVLFYDRGQFNAFLRTECPSLVRHCHSIQEKYFPEWNLEHARTLIQFKDKDGTVILE